MEFESFDFDFNFGWWQRLEFDFLLSCFQLCFAISQFCCVYGHFCCVATV